MRISLFAHNQIAFEAAEQMLDSAGRAAIIHPTGTGKSFIGFKFCEKYPEKCICWLSPSSYIFETQLEGLKTATGGFVPENIRFFTYTKLTLLSQCELEEIKPDYIILDEFHRCGAPTWGDAVDKFLGLYPRAFVLGLSATNIRYLDEQRDMALELFDGNIASEMTLGEAVVRGILMPPKYVLSVYSYKNDLLKYQRRIKKIKSTQVRDKAEEYFEALRRCLENAQGLDEIFNKHMPDRAGKYIVFCSDFEHMCQMKEKAPEWFSKVDSSPYIYTVYSDDPTAENSFREFKENNDPEHLKLLYCIDALNEGVHVKDISGVILLRPTVSPIIYKQQIGRAMSANANHDVVVFDVVMNIENLYSISMVRNEMNAAIHEFIYSENGSRIVNDRFEIIDEVKDCRLLFAQLNDTLSASWEYMYGQAKLYYEENGNLEVPGRYKTPEGYSLGSWIDVQRKVYKGKTYGILTDGQIRKLDAISMRWEILSDVRWDKYYSAAKQYYEKNGNLAVKSNFVTDDGIKLGTWVSNLRYTVNKCHGKKYRFLTKERIADLDSVGMIWNALDYRWEENFSAAKMYFDRYRHLNVPLDYVTDEGIRLGNWINNTRNNYKKKNHGTLSTEQISRLESIGMVWKSRFEDLWFSTYEKAQEYFCEHGGLDVPTTFKTPDGVQLGRWIVRQRQSREQGNLSEDRIVLLDKLNMIWQKPDPWQVRYSIAKDYFNEHGNTNIPTTLVVDGVWIGKWLSEQRKKKERLRCAQKQMLEDIGMQW